MLHRQTSTATRVGRTLASGLLCLSGLGVALAAPLSVAAAEPAAAPVTGASTGIALASTTETAATTVATTVAPTICTAGRWPASVQGRPRLHAGSRAGDYIWHDSAGWHLRVTHPGKRTMVFSGTIRSDAPLTVKGVHLERQDSFRLSPDGLTLTYRFVNHGRVDGLDFRTDCAKHLSFGGRLNGYRLAIGRIWIGHLGRHPLQNPFAVRRIG